MHRLSSVLLVSTILGTVSCGGTALDSPAIPQEATVPSAGAGNPSGGSAIQGAESPGTGGAAGGLGGTAGSNTVEPGSGAACAPPVDAGTSGATTSAEAIALEQEILTRWNQAARSVLTSYAFTWNAFAQFPHPTFKGGSAEAYGEFAQVLLAFFQQGDNFDFLARNCLFRIPLYYAMANGDHGQDWTFDGLAAYFASGVYGNTPEATRLALSAVSKRIQQIP